MVKSDAAEQAALEAAAEKYSSTGGAWDVRQPLEDEKDVLELYEQATSAARDFCDVLTAVAKVRRAIT